jgi:hypothetical protein
VPLPDKVAPIDIDDYLPSNYRQWRRPVPAVRSTQASNIAFARARQYEVQNGFPRAIYWQKTAISLVPPPSNDSQFYRLHLAHIYSEAGDIQRAAAVCREVIDIHRQHPGTLGIYAWDARGMLRRLNRRKDKTVVLLKPGGNQGGAGRKIP